MCFSFDGYIKKNYKKYRERVIMIFENCIVEIPEGIEERRNGAAYSQVKHGSNFSIKLGSQGQLPRPKGRGLRTAKRD